MKGGKADAWSYLEIDDAVRCRDWLFGHDMWKFISRFTLQNLFFSLVMAIRFSATAVRVLNRGEGDFSCVHGQACLALSFTTGPGNGCYTSGWWVYAAMWACVWERTW
jgi:hypothetical protein